MVTADHVHMSGALGRCTPVGEGEERGMGSVRVVCPEIGVANGGSRPGREVGEPPLSLRMGTGGVSN